MGDMKQHQPPLTIEEQIENLKSIGLVIKDEEIGEALYETQDSKEYGAI